MFHKISSDNKNKAIPLSNPQSSYKKLEKEMNKPPSDFNTIKSMVENGKNSFKNIDNKKNRNQVKMIAHKKK